MWFFALSSNAELIGQYRHSTVIEHPMNWIKCWIKTKLLSITHKKSWNRVDCQRSEKKRSKTHTRLKERFLLGRNCTFARFVLFRPIKKRSFNLLCVLDLFSITKIFILENAYKELSWWRPEKASGATKEIWLLLKSLQNTDRHLALGTYQQHRTKTEGQTNTVWP